MVDRADPTPGEPYQIPLLVPQFLTERVLRDRLAELGHAPVHTHELVGVDQDADSVRARIATPSGERTVQARYLVGADGGSSFVRRAMGIDFPGKTLGVRCWRATGRNAGRSPRRSSASPSGCSRRPRTATPTAAGRSASSISATRTRR